MNNLRIEMKVALALLLITLGVCAALPSARTGFATGTPTRERQQLVIFAAASLTEPFSELASVFEAANPDVDVILNFAGSQQLAEQLAQGAKADLFASANQKYMSAAIANGLVDRAAAMDFAKNELVVIAPKDNPAGLREYSDIASDGVKLVLADEAVPAGKYTREFFRAAGVEEMALSNVVSYEDNVKSVLSKVVLGEADAGVVYRSDISVLSGERVLSFMIPEEYNVIASYPIAKLVDARQPELSKAFLDLLMSSQGQGVMIKYNFVPVQ